MLNKNLHYYLTISINHSKKKSGRHITMGKKPHLFLKFVWGNFFLKVFWILLLMVQVASFYLYSFGYNIFLKMMGKNQFLKHNSICCIQRQFLGRAPMGASHGNWPCSPISQSIFNLFFFLMKNNLTCYLMLQFHKNRSNNKPVGVIQSSVQFFFCYCYQYFWPARGNLLNFTCYPEIWRAN